jgi:hypothetical protein
MTISQLNTLYTHGVKTEDDCDLRTRNVGWVKQSNGQEKTYIPKSQYLRLLMGRQLVWSHDLLEKKSEINARSFT